jgi:hypothetical protein
MPLKGLLHKGLGDHFEKYCSGDYNYNKQAEHMVLHSDQSYEYVRFLDEYFGKSSNFR